MEVEVQIQLLLKWSSTYDMSQSSVSRPGRLNNRGKGSQNSWVRQRIGPTIGLGALENKAHILATAWN